MVADENGTFDAADKVGAICLISMAPRLFPARMFGPDIRKDEFMSGRTEPVENAPCAAPLTAQRFYGATRLAKPLTAIWAINLAGGA